MTEDAPFADYPDRIRHGTAHPEIVYGRLPGWYAIQTAAGEEAVTVLHDDAGEALAVREGEPPDDAMALPVYATEGDGPPAVPTGLVFVRFADNVDAASRQAPLMDAGYEIVTTISYAPNAVWVRAISGGPAQALANLDTIEAVRDVENVEPQFLTEAHSRPGL